MQANSRLGNSVSLNQDKEFGRLAAYGLRVTYAPKIERITFSGNIDSGAESFTGKSSANPVINAKSNFSYLKFIGGANIRMWPWKDKYLKGWSFAPAIYLGGMRMAHTNFLDWDSDNTKVDYDYSSYYFIAGAGIEGGYRPHPSIEFYWGAVYCTGRSVFSSTNISNFIVQGQDLSRGAAAKDLKTMASSSLKYLQIGGGLSFLLLRDNKGNSDSYNSRGGSTGGSFWGGSSSGSKWDVFTKK